MPMSCETPATSPMIRAVFVEVTLSWTQSHSRESTNGSFGPTHSIEYCSK
jgi:hypothetical protein